MLAFLESPMQLMVAAVVILVVFGPQKLPEIAGQIGRALRELKRTTSDLQDSFSLDSNRYDEHYNPPHYDSYGNPTTESTASVPEADVWQPSTPETKAQAAITSGEPVHGDFAASALADTDGDYSYGVSSPAADHGGASAYAAPAASNGTGASHSDMMQVRPAEGSVPRQA